MRAAIVVLFAISASVAHADDLIAPPRYRRDVPIIVIGGSLYLVGDLPAEDALAPAGCRWCDDNPLDRGLRDALVWDDTGAAHTASNLAVYVATPVIGVALLGAMGGRRDLAANATILAEAAVLAADLTLLVKLAAGRERPFVHQLAPTDKPRTAHPAENNLSFYSGHANLAMSLAVAAGTTATLRGYRHHQLVWATTVPIALAAGYLRIAADRHWTTDVVTGWAMGAAVGFAVPYFLHRRGAAPLTPVVARSKTATIAGVALAW